MSRSTEEQSRLNVKNADEIYRRISNEEGIFSCVTLWLDLLGFRRHMDFRNWDLHHEDTKMGLRRIAAFHETALLATNDRYEIVQLNDAVVVSQDIPLDSSAKAVEEFLALADHTFEVAALTDAKIGGDGVRGVVAVGSRYNLRGNLGWTKEGQKDLRSPAFFCPRPIMMNMAFGRAYGVESSHQLDKETSLYVEQKLFTDYRIARIMETWTLDQMLEVDNFGPFLKVRSNEF